jgi:hypothetical protein
MKTKKLLPINEGQELIRGRLLTSTLPTMCLLKAIYEILAEIAFMVNTPDVTVLLT